MSDLYGLKLEPMPNRLVNYGVTTNGIAVIELTSNSAGAPIGRCKRPFTKHLYTRYDVRHRHCCSQGSIR